MDKPFTLKEFREIYSKVPRLCIEIVVSTPKGVLLTLRNIEPWENTWHLPGGTIYMNEKATDAVKRIANEELGVKASVRKFLGYLEYPSSTKLDFGWPVSLLFLTKLASNPIKLNDEATQCEYFTQFPENMLPEHKQWLKESMAKQRIEPV